MNKKKKMTTDTINDFTVQLGRTLTGTSDILTLVASSNGNNSNVVGGFGWYELT